MFLTYPIFYDLQIWLTFNPKKKKKKEANLEREREENSKLKIIINQTTKPKNLKTQERDNSQSTKMEFWQTQLIKSLERKRETEREAWFLNPNRID